MEDIWPGDRWGSRLHCCHFVSTGLSWVYKLHPHCQCYPHVPPVCPNFMKLYWNGYWFRMVTRAGRKERSQGPKMELVNFCQPSPRPESEHFRVFMI